MDSEHLKFVFFAFSLWLYLKQLNYKWTSACKLKSQVPHLLDKVEATGHPAKMFAVRGNINKYNSSPA